MVGRYDNYTGIPRCQHIKADGKLCEGAAMRGKRLCYFHHRWQQKHIVIGSRRAQEVRRLLDLPLLEDANAVQMALTQVIGLVLRNQIDHKSAGLALYGLQTASANLKQVSTSGYFEERVIDPEGVADVPMERMIWHPEQERRTMAQRKAEAEAAKAKREEQQKEAEPRVEPEPPLPQPEAVLTTPELARPEPVLSEPEHVSPGQPDPVPMAVDHAKPLPLRVQIYCALVNRLPPEAKERFKDEIVAHGIRLLSG